MVFSEDSSRKIPFIIEIMNDVRYLRFNIRDVLAFFFIFFFIFIFIFMSIQGADIGVKLLTLSSKIGC